jgi:hypothetical protein
VKQGVIRAFIARASTRRIAKRMVKLTRKKYCQLRSSLSSS